MGKGYRQEAGGQVSPQANVVATPFLSTGDALASGDVVVNHTYIITFYVNHKSYVYHDP